jgi:hypothetical protein
MDKPEDKKEPELKGNPKCRGSLAASSDGN